MNQKARVDKLLNTQFKKGWTLNLTTNDRPRYSHHYYADYIELLALFSNQNKISDSDVFSKLKDNGIFSANSDVEEGYDDIDDDSERSERNDKYFKKIHDWFLIVEERSIHLGDQYPFSFSYKEGSYYIVLKKRLLNIQKLYLFFLICSNLDLFSQQLRQFLTSDFEGICKEAIGSYLSTKFEVIATGKKSDLKGGAWDKIEALGKKLNLPLDVVKNEIKGNQEYGLDLISWNNFADNVPNFLILLAQCTCQKGWYSKMNDTNRWLRFYKYHMIVPQKSLFIPYAVLDLSNNVFYDQRKYDSPDFILFERIRLIGLFGKKRFPFNIPSKAIVSKCINIEEAVY